MNRPKGAFLCLNSDLLGRVYGETQIAELKRLCAIEENVFTEKDVDSGLLSETELIFSGWGMPALPPESLRKLPKLRAVFYAAGATDYFCRPFLARGIRVFSAWKANAVPVAEFTVAQIILGLKNYFNISASLKTPEAFAAGQKMAGRGAFGSRVALLGAGAISHHAEELLKGFDLDVIVVPSRPERRTITLEEAFRTSDVVSNHFPDRADNAGILDGKLFASMPHGAVFINTGRGRQVKEDELVEVLKKRPDLTALLDVTFPEPPPGDSELYTLPNIHLSPHIAGSLNGEIRRMADCMTGECRRFLRGEPVLYEVKKENLISAN